MFNKRKIILSEKNKLSFCSQESKPARIIGILPKRNGSLSFESDFLFIQFSSLNLEMHNVSNKQIAVGCLMAIQLAILLNLIVRSLFFCLFYFCWCYNSILICLSQEQAPIYSFIYESTKHRNLYFPDIFEMNLFLRDYYIFLGINEAIGIYIFRIYLR